MCHANCCRLRVETTKQRAVPDQVIVVGVDVDIEGEGGAAVVASSIFLTPTVRRKVIAHMIK